MIILIGTLTFVATVLGGMFALRFKDKLHLILGFSAGAMIAVAFFDLLPEAFALASDAISPEKLLLYSAIGFFGFMILDRSIVLHGCHSEGHSRHHGAGGKLGAGALSLHSFLDGVLIGLAFQVSASVGAVVAAAVLVHDFSDGINTTNLILKNGGTKREALKWLAIDALAPILGVVATFFFTLPASALSIILSLFAGFFLYIGASDLLPESHHNHPTIWTTIATLLGVFVLYGAIYLAGI